MKKVLIAATIFVSLATVSCKKTYVCSDCASGETVEVEAKSETGAEVDCTFEGCATTTKK